MTRLASRKKKLTKNRYQRQDFNRSTFGDKYARLIATISWNCTNYRWNQFGQPEELLHAATYCMGHDHMPSYDRLCYTKVWHNIKSGQWAQQHVNRRNHMKTLWSTATSLGHRSISDLGMHAVQNIHSQWMRGITNPFRWDETVLDTLSPMKPANITKQRAIPCRYQTDVRSVHDHNMEHISDSSEVRRSTPSSAHATHH